MVSFMRTAPSWWRRKWLANCATLACCSLLYASAAVEDYQDASNPQFWVYSLVGTDYDGHKMLPYFLQHYRALGIEDSHFHFDLLHNPTEPGDGIMASTSLLMNLGLSFKIISKPYTPALQDIQMMLTLDSFDIPPMDWIIVADTDELYTYGYPTLAEAAAVMEAENATYALGEMLDHVSRNGTLSHLQENYNLFDQFPMICPVTGEIGLGLTAKVTLHRGFLRVGAGHHHIVDPKLAKAYFTKRCAGDLCETVMKLYKQRSTADLFHKTPYYRLHSEFRAAAEQVAAGQQGMAWEANMWKTWTKVHHFKWHNGMLQNLRHRAQRDSGDCKLGVNEATCKPNFLFWQEVARQYAHVSAGSLNVTKLRCREDVDTFWNWRQYKRPLL